MRRLLMVMATALMPVLASAGYEEHRPEWTACSADEQCVVIDGPCSPAAVHKDYVSAASAYFKEQSMLVKCRKQFWQPTKDNSGAKCWQERCQIVGKD